MLWLINGAKLLDKPNHLFEDLEAFQEDYGDDYESIDEIGQATTVIMFAGTSFIIQNF